MSLKAIIRRHNKSGYMYNSDCNRKECWNVSNMSYNTTVHKTQMFRKM